MAWKPISEADLIGEINESRQRMNLPQRRFWDFICVEPQKWSLHPYGDEGGGFWVVGLVGRSVVWFNDIEDGFQRSHYSHLGEIEEYRCNEDNLEWVVQALMNALETGHDPGPFAGPPQPYDPPRHT